MQQQQTQGPGGLRELASGAPTVNNPGGIGPAFDQAMQGYEIVIGALEQLAQELKFMDDAESAEIQMIAAKLRQKKAKKQAAIQSAQATMQGAAGGQSISPVIGG